MSGRKLGKYEVVDRIGRGGMAEVYRAYHPALDRYVAIKILHPFLSDDPEFKERFEREARNVARLKHPNIVQVYDFDYDPEGESYYMVMEMINGPTLKDRLLDLSNIGQTFPLGDTLHIIGSAAEALAYAHARSMIHRDVKPANLMIDEDSRVVLTDFGIAKIVTGAQFTSTGGMVGTPAYMAPEQGMAEPGDERSDLYSLGVIMYQMATGRLPFDADTPLAVILKHLNEPLIAPSQYVPGIPNRLESIICKALEKDPAHRYQSALEMLEDLDQLAGPNRRPRTYDTMTRMGGSNALSSGDTGRFNGSGRQVGSPGRLRPSRVLMLALLVAVLGLVGLLSFSDEGTPLASFLDPNRSGATSIPFEQTEEAAPDNAVASRGTTTEESVSPEAPTPSPLPTTASQPTATIIPTRQPTRTPSPAPSDTPTPDMTLTAVVALLTLQAAATPTPDMTQTLAACDFEFIVATPDNISVPPSTLPRDYANPRLVRASQNFEFELALKNTGSCAWPEQVRLRYNEALSENPENLDLEPLNDACADTSIQATNFATQGQSNFYFQNAVNIDQQTDALVFTGTAPRTFSCYYGVWDVLYPNSNLRIGHPLIIAIRVWGSS